jgi:hypothetical protein
VLYVGRGRRPPPSDWLPGLLPATHAAESRLPSGVCRRAGWPHRLPFGSSWSAAPKALSVSEICRGQRPSWCAAGDTWPDPIVSQDAQRLAGAVARRQPLQGGAEAFVFLSTQHGGLAEGPLEPGVALLATADTNFLARRLLGRRDQPGVGAELLARVEAFDGVDLQQHGQAQKPIPYRLLIAATQTASHQ